MDEFDELWDALAERDAAELKLALIAGVCDEYDRYEFVTPSWINTIRDILNRS
jgi:hypothetical protein